MRKRLGSRHGKGKALAILAHRLGRAVYYMLKNQVPFDQARFLRQSTEVEGADQPERLTGQATTSAR